MGVTFTAGDALDQDVEVNEFGPWNQSLCVLRRVERLLTFINLRLKS